VGFHQSSRKHERPVGKKKLAEMSEIMFRADNVRQVKWGTQANSMRFSEDDKALIKKFAHVQRLRFTSPFTKCYWFRNNEKMPVNL